MLKRRSALPSAATHSRAIVSHNYPKVVERWILRLLIQGKAAQRFISANGFVDDDVLRFIGLGRYEWDLADDSAPLSPVQCRNVLRKRFLTIDAKKPVYRGVLFRNLRSFSRRLELSEAELLLLAFAVLKDMYPELSTVWEWTTAGRDRLSGWDVLANVLALTPSEVEFACASEGKLTASGVLDCSNGQDLVPRLELLEGLGKSLLSRSFRVEGMLGQYFSMHAGKRLRPKDFAHLGSDLEDLQAYLRQVAKRREPGSNILLWGPPGVGKTELARTLAAECGLTLNEVACTGADGEAISPSRRRNLYRLCQHLLKTNPNAVVLFDEMEDFFAEGVEEDGCGGPVGKAWFNRLLERSPVPSIWISNAIDMIDPAFLRRFDYVLELGAPPPETRKSMLAGACRDLKVSDNWLDRMAGFAHVTPAQLGQAAKLARLIGGRDRADIERVMETSIRRHLKLQGQRVHCSRRPVDGLIDYDLELLNPDRDLHELVAGLAQSGTGTCLLYGPPGTGKSALAHYLARTLKRPLLKKAASDLLDPFIGVTEQKLAAMFEEAMAMGGVLFLDEADSFLRSRGMARQSWEVTQVNELLQQMENFEGIFVCATNFLQVTDDAALRRFDHKIRLGYLTPKQRERLLKVIAEKMGLVCPAEMPLETRQHLARLHNLATGDFATLVRQNARGGWRPTCLEDLLTALERESRLKPDGNARPMGFVV